MEHMISSRIIVLVGTYNQGVNIPIRIRMRMTKTSNEKKRSYRACNSHKGETTKWLLVTMGE